MRARNTRMPQNIYTQPTKKPGLSSGEGRTQASVLSPWSLWQLPGGWCVGPLAGQDGRSAVARLAFGNSSSPGFTVGRTSGRTFDAAFGVCNPLCKLVSSPWRTSFDLQLLGNRHRNRIRVLLEENWRHARRD